MQITEIDRRKAASDMRIQMVDATCVVVTCRTEEIKQQALKAGAKQIATLSRTIEIPRRLESKMREMFSMASDF